MSDAPIGLLTSGAQTLSAGAAEVPITMGYYPQEGSRSITAQYGWPNASGANIYVDRLRGTETTVQSIYVDNSQCGWNVNIMVPRTNQNIVIPGNSQGWYPIIASDSLTVQISTNAQATGVTRISYLNVPCNTAGVWSTNAFAGGAQSSLLNFGGANLTLKQGPGRLYAVNINTAPTATIAFVDNTAPGGSNFLVLLPTAMTVAGAIFNWPNGIPFFNGLSYDSNGGSVSAFFT